ncbi:MAG: hypothetical protein PHQ23_02715, partial [Candidatus Wallbacteria bacterium]|nr:hypothetical protein [Candidatus Wallbacteria bacterium]
MIFLILSGKACLSFENAGRSIRRETISSVVEDFRKFLVEEVDLSYVEYRDASPISPNISHL